jgi:hypothetical protein
MRPIVALGILLLGLNGATPKLESQNSSVPAGDPSRASSPAILKADRQMVLPVPPALWIDEAHEQAEQGLEAAASAIPAGADLLFDVAAPQSLDELCNALMVSAEDNALPVPFFANLIWQESRLQHDAVSRVGAVGIAQFMPEVAAEVGLGDPFDPRQAIPASARLLHTLRQHFGNLGLVAAAYNAGARRVSEWLDRRRALPRETRTYVMRVTGRSVEAWRQTPLDDIKLTFAKPLPCRQLPAYADLEQARQQEAQELAQAEELRARELRQARDQQAREQAAAHDAAPKNAKLAQQAGRKISPKMAPRTSLKLAQTSRAEMRSSRLGHHKPAHEPGHGAATGIIARNFHVGRHDGPRPHPSHERRRVAQDESAQHPDPS